MTHLTVVEESFNELRTIYNNDKTSYEYCLRENEQLKSQNEHLLNELARLTQLETRDRTRLVEQNDLRRQYDDILNQYSVACWDLTTKQYGVGILAKLTYAQMQRQVS